MWWELARARCKNNAAAGGLQPFFAVKCRKCAPGIVSIKYSPTPDFPTCDAADEVGDQGAQCRDSVGLRGWLMRSVDGVEKRKMSGYLEAMGRSIQD